MKVGVKYDFKPVQRGVLITSKSYIELTLYLIVDKGYRYVLGGRLTTDRAENIFSALRIHHQILNGLQVKQNLRAVGVSQYLRPVGSSLTSYEQDDRPLLCIDLDALRRSAKIRRDEYQISLPPIPDLSETQVTFKTFEPYALYHCAGYIMSRIDQFCPRVCKDCKGSAGSKQFSPSRYSKLTELKRYTEVKNTLFFVNDETFDFFFAMETVFKQYLPYFMQQVAHLHYDLESFFFKELMAIEFEFVKVCTRPDCIDLKTVVIKRFTRFKLFTSNYKTESKGRVYNSKTEAMHAAVK